MLFSQLKIRDLVLKNRVVLAPMVTFQAHNGYVNNSHIVHYGKYSVGGVGLIFVESTKVDSRGPTTSHDLGIWKDDFLPGLKQLVDIIKLNGSAAGIQLGHAGAKAKNFVPWEGRCPNPDAVNIDNGGNWDIISPSSVKIRPESQTPSTMSLEDIAEVINYWQEAADRANRAGFDVIGIHGAHGYLIHEFLSSHTNHRNDQYGGSFENRIRFALDIVSAVRKVWPENKPLFFRVSSIDEAGWTITDSVRFAKELAKHGVDVIDCSSGGLIPNRLMNPTDCYQVPYADEIKNNADIKTMAVGLIKDAKKANDILLNGQADLIALGRELLNNPNWTLHAAVELKIDDPWSVVPPHHGYWLEKRDKLRQP